MTNSEKLKALGQRLRAAPPGEDATIEINAEFAYWLVMAVEAGQTWLDKTGWVQDEINTFPISSLGQHRADVMTQEIHRLRHAKRELEKQVRIAEDCVFAGENAFLTTRPSLPETQMAIAREDARLAGTGFLYNGWRMDPMKVMIVSK